VSVQLREKDLAAARALLELARPLRALTEKYAATLYINDRVDVAPRRRRRWRPPWRNLDEPVGRGGDRPRRWALRFLHTALRISHASRIPPTCDSPSLVPSSKHLRNAGWGAPLGVGVLRATFPSVPTVPLLAIGGITVEKRAPRVPRRRAPLESPVFERFCRRTTLEKLPYCCAERFWRPDGRKKPKDLTRFVVLVLSGTISAAAAKGRSN